MISKKYLNQSLRIRRDFLKTDTRLLGLKDNLEIIKENLGKSLKELKDLSKRSAEFNSEEEFKEEVIKYLHSFEAETKKVQDLYKPLNEDMEKLKVEEQNLFNELIEKYPKIKEEEIFKQIQDFLKENEV